MKIIVVLVGVISVFIAGCDAGTQKADFPIAPGPVAAMVNGTAISEVALEAFSKQFVKPVGGSDIPREKLLNDLVNRELLRQEYMRKGFEIDPEAMAEIENSTRFLVSQAYARNFKTNVAISEEKLRDLYIKSYVSNQPMEYKARHILVAKEEDAVKIIKSLGKGEAFEVLVSKYSEDAGTKDKGGELGWFLASGMVPPFSLAVEQLKNGETTPLPVKSQYGWHVIQRQDARQKEAPPFNEVKEQIINREREALLREQIELLKKGASISIEAKQ